MYIYDPYPLRRGYVENCKLQFWSSKQKKCKLQFSTSDVEIVRLQFLRNSKPNLKKVTYN